MNPLSISPLPLRERGDRRDSDGGRGVALILEQAPSPALSGTLPRKGGGLYLWCSFLPIPNRLPLFGIAQEARSIHPRPKRVAIMRQRFHLIEIKIKPKTFLKLRSHKT